MLYSESPTICNLFSCAAGNIKKKQPIDLSSLEKKGHNLLISSRRPASVGRIRVMFPALEERQIQNEFSTIIFNMAEDLDTLLTRHRKEQKTLIAQTTALKKAVTKGEKSKRKEVLAEVERLEKRLRDRHHDELNQFKSREAQNNPEDSQSPLTNGTLAQHDPIEGVKLLSLDDSRDISTGTMKGKGKVNRKRAKMARRVAEMEEQRQIAAEEAIAMPDLGLQEQTAMQKIFGEYDLREESIRPDGNCLYAAVASQLNSTTSDKYDYKKIRGIAASFIKENRKDFEPFLLADDFSSARDIESYCREIEETALWGGEMEITALSRALDVPVEIYSSRSLSPLIVRPDPVGKEREFVIRLAYYEHLYGLGQHYNCLYKI